MNVYEIFTKISMQNAVSGVLATIAKEVLSLEGGIKSLSKELETFRGKLAIGGALSFAAGAGIVTFLGKAASDAKELSHQLAQIQQLGINQRQFAQAQASAFGVSQTVPGITESTALKIYGQIYSPLGHENALKMLEPLAKFSQVLGGLTGDYGGAIDKLNKLVRAGDLLGKFMNSMTHQVDLGKLERFLDLGARVTQATHGMVSPETWFGLAQQGGPAMSNMSDKGLLTMAMIAQMMGGPRAGTALSSLFTQFQGGIMTKWRAKKLQEIGIIDPNAIEDITSGGHIMWRKGLEPGNTPFAKAMADDPLKAIDILQRAMATHGYPTIEKQVPLLFELFQRQTSLREIHDLLRNKTQLLQERERIAGGLGISASNVLANDQDYIRNLHNLSEAWKNMMEQVGLPITVIATERIKQVTGVLLEVAKFAHEHPNDFENIARGLGYLGVILVGGGAYAILGALGPGGWIAGGIIAIGIAALSYKNTVGEWIKSVSDFGTKIKNSITDMFQGILDWIKDHIPAWMRGAGYEGGGIGGGGIIRTAFESGGGGLGGSLGGFGMGGKSWSQMNEAEKTSLLAAQRNKEGWYPGSRSFVNNNPGNIRYGEFARAHGATGEAGGFAVFPNEAAGAAAQRALWGTSGYANLPLGQALSRWGTGALPGFGSGASGVAGGPSHIGGLLSLGGESFHFGSGGGLRQHIPFGDYPITPGSIGPWGMAHGAIGLNNNAIWDSTLNRMRTGIEMHPGHGDALFTAGCIAIAKGEWPAFKSKVQELMHLHGQAFLHVGRGGASITPNRSTVTPYHRPEQAHGPIHNVMYLDGEPIHRSIVKRMVRGMTHPTTAPYHDGSRHWTPPDAGLVGV